MSYGDEETLVFIDENVQRTNVKIPFIELKTKPLPPSWRNFFNTHFQDGRRKNQSFSFSRESVQTKDEFSDFFEKIMNKKNHIVTECLETYKIQFEKDYIAKYRKMNDAISNIREFITCFSLFLSKEWGVGLSFFGIMFRNIAKNIINNLYPLLIGLYVCKQRNQEISVTLNTLERSNLQLDELGLPENLQVDYEKAWKILKKTTRSQNVITLAKVLNYFYYQVFECIDSSPKNKRKVKVKDVDISKILLFCISKAQISQQNVHCIVNLVFDFSHGIVSEKEFCVVNLIHSIFSWMNTSLKIETDSEFAKYSKKKNYKGSSIGHNHSSTMTGTLSRKDFKSEHQRRIAEQRKKLALRKTHSVVPQNLGRRGKK